MTAKIAKIVKTVLHLPRESRALIAESLLESLDYEEYFEVSAEWKNEIMRRAREIDQKRVKLISAEKVFEDLAKKLA